MASSVDPDEMPHSAASHLCLHCFLRPVCPNTYGMFGTFGKKLVLMPYMENDDHDQTVQTHRLIWTLRDRICCKDIFSHGVPRS